MAIDLSTITFTNNADIIPSLGTDNIILDANRSVRTYSGNDILTGIATNMTLGKNGIENRGSIDTGLGDDLLTGVSTSTSFPGNWKGIENYGKIETGLGNDKIFAKSLYTGLFNRGIVDTASDDDTIVGEGGSTYYDIVNGGLIDTGDGNDRIEGRLDNRVIIRTGSGNDTIKTLPFSTNPSLYNQTNATIDTGEGNDLITGLTSDSNWITNKGTISTGSGDDTIDGMCFNSPSSVGILNADGGKIDTGAGKDIIRINGILNPGDGSGKGIYNQGIIDTGDNEDTIESSGSDTGINNEATIVTGNGNDTITGNTVSSFGYGIYNTGSIDLGLGDDIITGRRYSPNNYGGVGIFNSGSINTGAGNDVVDALRGGFGGDGDIQLGAGNDIVKGFGTGYFDGGNGKDYLVFGAGTYAVTRTAIPDVYTVTSGTTSMSVKNFEFIASSSDPNNVFEFLNLIGNGQFVIA